MESQVPGSEHERKATPAVNQFWRNVGKAPVLWTPCKEPGWWRADLAGLVYLFAGASAHHSGHFDYHAVRGCADAFPDRIGGGGQDTLEAAKSNAEALGIDYIMWAVIELGVADVFGQHQTREVQSALKDARALVASLRASREHGLEFKLPPGHGYAALLNLEGSLGMLDELQGAGSRPPEPGRVRVYGAVPAKDLADRGSSTGDLGSPGRG